MKKTLLIIAVLIETTSFAAQPDIKNGSFESWTTVDSVEYLDDMPKPLSDSIAFTDGRITKSTKSSVGSYGVQISDGSFYLEDSISTAIGGMSFDYSLIGNSFSSVDGLIINAYYYDTNHDQLEYEQFKFREFSESFKIGEMVFNLPIGAKYFMLWISHRLVDGVSTDHVVVDNFKFVGSVSVESVRKKQLVNVYPNPVSSLLTVVSDVVIGSYELYNNVGAVVKQGAGTNSKSLQIVCGDLAAGSYDVKVLNSDGTVSYSKVIMK